ncbi:MAG: heavy metal-binding domain-containing protein [Actinobacteria bacterium]|nr:heavy metal-binding domain-containing protein [Actinomycetota bacterium]
MIIVTSDTIPGKKIVKTIGMVKGNTIRARAVGRDILAGLKQLVGGEIQEYTKLMAESREQAIDRMIVSATETGANAIVAVRFSTSEIMSAAAEILIYGTAVVVEDGEE